MNIVLMSSLLFLFMVMVAFLMPVVQADAESSIDAANQSINQAYLSILAAEEAGGNVTQLLINLNIAGNLLAEAENDYTSGNLENVISKADNASQIADQVNTEALTLKDASLTALYNNFWYTVTFSIVGTVVFGVIVLLAWKRYKRGYLKRMLSYKLELVNIEN